MNAVIYVRYSSENQRSESIDAQIRAIEKYAKENGYKVIYTYIDEAKSARSDNRPAFQKMINDSEKSSFQFIIVHKLDRLLEGLSRYYSVNLVREVMKGLEGRYLDELK